MHFNDLPRHGAVTGQPLRMWENLLKTPFRRNVSISPSQQETALTASECALWQSREPPKSRFHHNTGSRAWQAWPPGLRPWPASWPCSWAWTPPPPAPARAVRRCASAGGRAL